MPTLQVSTPPPNPTPFLTLTRSFHKEFQCAIFFTFALLFPGKCRSLEFRVSESSKVQITTTSTSFLFSLFFYCLYPLIQSHTHTNFFPRQFNGSHTVYEPTYSQYHFVSSITIHSPILYLTALFLTLPLSSKLPFHHLS